MVSRVLRKIRSSGFSLLSQGDGLSTYMIDDSSNALLAWRWQIVARPTEFSGNVTEMAVACSNAVLFSDWFAVRVRTRADHRTSAEPRIRDFMSTFSVVEKYSERIKSVIVDLAASAIDCC
jgi:hypothetical protein